MASHGVMLGRLVVLGLSYRRLETGRGKDKKRKWFEGAARGYSTIERERDEGE
jgi:hypothetical protein